MAQRIREEVLKCDFVRFTVTDIHGIQRGRSVVRAHLPEYLENGLSLFSGAVAVGPRTQVTELDVSNHPEDSFFGNVTAKPVMGTWHMLPWAGGPKYQVGEVLCETMWADGTNQEACSRYLARKQLEALGKRGFRLLSGWEAELYLIDRKTQKPLSDGTEMFSELVLAENEEFYYDMITQMRSAGIDVEGVELECGPGQLEMVTKPTEGMKGADLAVSLKQAVKEISWQRGYQATFMTKPYDDHFGSGFHHNFSILDTKNYNVFKDPNSKYGLSDFGKHWMAGIIKHAGALTALCCPTFNCYRRLHSQFVPHTASWIHHDRAETTLRVKNGSRGCFIENRLPSAACNPYLVVAGCVAAGLDGINNRLKCPPENEKQAAELPHTLEEALCALEQDSAMKEALGSEFINWFCCVKRQHELKQFEELNPKESSIGSDEKDMYFKTI